MIRVLIYVSLALLSVGMVLADARDGALSLLVIVVVSALAISVFRRSSADKDFITHVFLAALATRLLFGLIIHVYDLRDFAGPDSFTYDYVGSRISDYWLGRTPMDGELERIMSIRGPGWGMNYLMGFLYLVFGKSILAAQSFCAVVGAAVAPMLYLCAERIFNNRRVSRTAAIVAALFPAFIIWSGQLLKDGLMVFLVVLAVTVVIEIQRRFSIIALAMLVLSLAAILSLRFYIFYMVAAAVVGSFAVGVDTSRRAIIQRVFIVTAVGLALTYLGVLRTASADLSTYGSLERAQITRSFQNQGGSGYASEGDVSTVGGAVAAIPVGFLYMMFAPFPWEVRNARQALTLPDILLWWAMWPLIIYGLWYTIRHRLRAAFPVLLFTLMLTISYSIFQGNLGAAYRQRTQIQVFLFLFMAVGWSILRERRADQRLVELNRKRAMDGQLRARLHSAR